MPDRASGFEMPNHTLIVDDRVSRDQFAEQIAIWRGSVIDLDAVVDDRRRDRDDADIALHDAIRERDAASRHLQQLIAWAEHGD